MDQSDFPLLFARALKRSGYVSNFRIFDSQDYLNGFEHECAMNTILWLKVKEFNSSLWTTCTS